MCVSKSFPTCVASPARCLSDMAAQCVTKVELTVSCENLLDKDIGSKSDPLCVLLMSSADSQWYEVRRMSGSGFIYYITDLQLLLVGTGVKLLKCY